MTKQNIQWCADHIINWLNEDPSLEWSEIWEALADCLDGERVTVWDRVQIKKLINNARD